HNMMKKGKKISLSILLPTVLLLLCSVYTFAQQRTISGIVRDAQGQLIEGATVALRASNTVVSTNASGRFAMQAASGAVLSVSYVGYVTQEIAVDQKSEYLVVL